MAKNIDGSVQQLLSVITGLNNEEETRRFLIDLCTIKELQDMAQRLETAVLLDKGKSYQEITALTGVSAATISRVARCLNYGQGGYRSVLAQMKNQED